MPSGKTTLGFLMTTYGLDGHVSRVQLDRKQETTARREPRHAWMTSGVDSSVPQAEHHILVVRNRCILQGITGRSRHPNWPPEAPCGDDGPSFSQGPHCARQRRHALADGDADLSDIWRIRELRRRGRLIVRAARPMGTDHARDRTPQPLLHVGVAWSKLGHDCHDHLPQHVQPKRPTRGARRVCALLRHLRKSGTLTLPMSLRLINAASTSHPGQPWGW
jgi:hypothetical protein